MTKTTTRKKSHGGARRGAGRKAIIPNKTDVMTVRVRPVTRERILALAIASNETISDALDRLVEVGFRDGAILGILSKSYRP
jgi:hypothetical protein